MFRDAYPVRWVGSLAIVTLPEHIDVSNAGQIREELLSVINRGADEVVADMAATISCDHAGADAVARAYQRAVVSGAQLRLVVTAQIVRRVLSLSGLDRLISIYPSLDAAIAAETPATAFPPPPGGPGPTPAAARRPAGCPGHGAASSRQPAREPGRPLRRSPLLCCGRSSTP